MDVCMYVCIFISVYLYDVDTWSLVETQTQNPRSTLNGTA